MKREIAPESSDREPLTPAKQAEGRHLHFKFDGLSFDTFANILDHRGGSVFYERRKILKRLISMLLVVLAVVTVIFNPPAFAADANHGAQVFSANCAACHIGGGNVVNAAKTLKKSDLDKYGMASADAIKTQVNNGKNAMPSFNGRLSPADIEDVAAYVLSQSEKGW
jgi:cytochrome c6